MKKVILILFFFLLNGCSIDSFLARQEVNKTQVVKSSSYFKFYRTYLTRSQLRPLRKNKKYLFFYNKRAKDLSVLVHRRNTYILYSLYHPKKDPIVVKTTSRRNYKHVLKKLKHKNYFPTTCKKIACKSHIALRKYKGIKTLLIEVKDYSKLQNMYKKAIRNYQSNILKSKIKLPKSFISSYFKSYEKQAKTEDQLEQLRIIGKRLNLPSSIKRKKEEKKKRKKKRNTDINTHLEIETPEKTLLPYSYYLNDASYDELSKYLDDEKTKDILDESQYNALKKKYLLLKEEYILNHVSLEELISEYKRNKNPRYKAQILLLMKKAQETK